jgi:hypothetical protein
MDRSEQKNARLKERLDRLRREIGVVEKDIHDLHRAVQHPERQSAMRRLSKMTESRESRPAQTSVPPAQPPQTGPEFAGGQVLDEEGVPKMSPDQRFASYFVTGSLHSVRPLRTERRIQRNKAIVMVIVAIVLVYGVISLLLN